MLNQVPQEIQNVIDQYEKEIEEKKLSEDIAKATELLESEKKGKAIYDEFLNSSLLLVPEWIRPFLDTNIEIDFHRIAKGWDRTENMVLNFDIPDLAGIKFSPSKNQWRCASAIFPRSYEYGLGAPYISFTDSSWWRESLPATLKIAKEVMAEHKENLAKYELDLLEDEKRRVRAEEQEAQRQAEQKKLDALFELKQQKEVSEQDALFDAIKDDAVALNMLRAFVLLRGERSHFETRINELDETLYFVEHDWSRRASELRRQADEAQRRADDEKRRLQSDLDDAESKLRKTKRGW